MDSIDATNQVRISRGLDPLPDPTRISGSEGIPFPAPRLSIDQGRAEARLPGGMPAQLLQDEPVEEPLEPQEDITEPGPAPEPSPLMKMAQESRRAQKLSPEISIQTGTTHGTTTLGVGMGTDGLIVIGTDAAYRNRAVVLSQREKAAVAKIVIGAITRSLNEQLAEVRAALPKRQRKGERAKFTDVLGRKHDVELSPKEPAKKRGRPKKS